MKAGRGKSKGSAFERLVCNRLSLWVSNGKSVDLYWRSAMSGGRATVRNRKRVEVRQAGDICAVSPEGHALTDQFYIECKHYRNLQIDRFMVLGTGRLMKFWRETIKQAARYEKQPMLIAKQNGMPIIVVTRHAIGSALPLLVEARTKWLLYLFDDMLANRFKV